MTNLLGKVADRLVEHLVPTTTAAASSVVWVRCYCNTVTCREVGHVCWTDTGGCGPRCVEDGPRCC